MRRLWLMESEGRKMILYFSCTGHTETAAARLQEVLRETTTQLEAAEPYSMEDIDWQVDDCRANKEQRDQLPLPSLKDHIDLSGVDTLYLGFPIWWGIPPKVIDTFLQTHVLSGIKTFLFCSSGGSSINEAEKYLRTNYPDINWAKGIRYHRAMSDTELSNWANA